MSIHHSQEQAQSPVLSSSLPPVPFAELNRAFGPGADASWALSELYGGSAESVIQQLERYQTRLERFYERFGPMAVEFFSAPGRGEFGGNHTDHNAGKVLTASIDLDSMGVAAPNSDGRLILDSEGFPETVVDLRRIDEPSDNRTESLVRGLLRGMRDSGYQIGGANISMDSRVFPGSGLSSSASLELLFLQIQNHFYNEGKIDVLDLARIGQWAENTYWKKLSGRLDQLGSALGGLNLIDFADKDNPRIVRLPERFAELGCSIFLIDTRSNHAHDTQEYGKVPTEMWEVAKLFGKENLGEVDPAEFDRRGALVKNKLGDRHWTRADHFFRENERVESQAHVLLTGGKLVDFLRLVHECGISSALSLQNSFDPAEPSDQSINVALRDSHKFFQSRRDEWQWGHGDYFGAVRVHGGGFGGTIIAFVRDNCASSYKQQMEEMFGEGCVHPIAIRKYGAVNVSKLARERGVS